MLCSLFVRSSISCQHQLPDSPSLASERTGLLSDFNGNQIEKSGNNNKSRQFLTNDCLRLCVELLPRKVDVYSLRLTSKSCYRVCNEFLQSQYFHLLFNQTTKQKRLRTWQDMQKYVPLIPRMYVHLSDNATIRYLFDFHENHSKNMIRGFDDASKRPFISIIVISTRRYYWFRYLILIPFGMFSFMNHVTAYIDWKSVYLIFMHWIHCCFIIRCFSRHSTVTKTIRCG